MVFIVMFYLLTIIVLFCCLSSSNIKRQNLDETVKDLTSLNEVLSEQIETYKAKQLHLNYLVAEKNDEIAKLRTEVIALNVKNSKKRKK